MSTISIVMPARNAEPFLVECLQSICGQSYEDWQLIAVDDNSTDNTLSILREYSKTDKRIIFMSAEGKGIIDALQQGYNRSSGTYITRMDADDIMPMQKLEWLYSALQEACRGYLATGMVKYFSSQPVGDGYKKYERWLNELTRDGTNFSDIYKECPIASPNWMIHRADFEKCGGFSHDIYPEDYDLCFRMRGTGLKVIPVQEVTHLWRDHPTRSSRNDPNYSDNLFGRMKVNYFLLDDWDKSKEIVLWGAGEKGKAIAKILATKEVPFLWVTNNPKKIGKDIYGVRMNDINSLSGSSPYDIIIAISQQGTKEKIQKKLDTFSDSDPYWFC